VTKTKEDNYVPALKFHFLTPVYDLVVRSTTRERRFKQALIAQAAVRPGQRVLDLACGTGTLSIWAKQRQPSAELVGVDGDPAILGIAERKAKAAGVAVVFDQAMSYALPYPDAHFDRVLTSLFFHHLSWEDKQRTARELLRVLKPGGELHVADWGKPANGLMRVLYLPVQWLDGYSNTEENAKGRLMPMFKATGFIDVQERDHFNTLLGTLRLFTAVRPLPEKIQEQLSS
tara:strand:+ start:6025 stop:6717 length:693 start_codon:yes stop_codon:yes gene_type:complete